MFIKYIKLFMKSCYLMPIKLLASIKRQRNEKIVFLLSFPSTSEYILNALAAKYKDRLIICYTEEAAVLANTLKERNISTFALTSLVDLYTHIIPALSRAQVILCDNYFAIFAGFNFAEDQKIVQLWHANGAVKKFGVEANYAKQATKIDQRRYQRVYNQYTHVVVSSLEMARIFAKSYLNDYEVLPFGYPPTDAYFQKKDLQESFYDTFGLDANKKTVLYAPTYREGDETNKVNLQELYQKLPENWQLVVRPHPHDQELKNQLVKLSEGIQISEEIALSRIFSQIDCLITDYSSIPFEYTLARKQGKIIYFCYDLEAYDRTVGLQENFIEWATPNLVRTTSELLSKLTEESYDDFEAYNDFWNTFAKGNAANQLIEWIDKQYEN
jgi:CDP-glycerol glycerophosphotransferase (TagB/SpsB family)